MNVKHSSTGQYMNASLFQTKVSHDELEKKDFLLPNDHAIDEMDPAKLMMIYWRYINTIQYLCRNQQRLGLITDGGKEVCFDESYRPRNPCLVYSFGSHNQFDFEVDVHRHLGCEVHTFDPSMKKVGKRINTFTTFHSYGLGARDFYDTRKKWNMKRLTSIIKELGHSERYIDILKIDIEGDEWCALPDIIQSAELFRVRQLCIEVHFGRNKICYNPQQNITSYEQIKVLKMLYTSGFRTFMRDHNAVRVIELFHTQISPLNELSMVNVLLKEL
ncbi:Methyltransferase-like protein 24 [Mactra antiquata]